MYIFTFFHSFVCCLVVQSFVYSSTCHTFICCLTDRSFIRINKVIIIIILLCFVCSFIHSSIHWSCFCSFVSVSAVHIDVSRDYRPYWFTETKESICIRIEFNSQRFSLGHQYGRHFFVLGHQHAAVTSCENTL